MDHIIRKRRTIDEVSLTIHILVIDVKSSHVDCCAYPRLQSLYLRLHLHLLLILLLHISAFWAIQYNLNPWSRHFTKMHNQDSITDLGLEQETVMVTEISSSDIVKIKMKLIKHFGDTNQTVDLLFHHDFDRYFIIDNPNGNIYDFWFPL